MVDNNALPAVCKIVADTERLLSSVMGTRVTVKLSIAGETVNNDEAGLLTLQSLVCQAYGVTWRDMAGPRRNGRLPDARKVYCYLARNLFDNTLSLRVIGDTINRDHTTVIHHVRRATELLSLGDGIVKTISNIKKAFYESVDKIEA